MCGMQGTRNGSTMANFISFHHLFEGFCGDVYADMFIEVGYLYGQCDVSRPGRWWV